MILAKTCRSLAANAVLTSISDCGTLRTPAAVLMSTGNTDRTPTMNSLAASPSPNQRMTNGTMATIGIAYKALIASRCSIHNLVAANQQAQRDSNN